MQSQDIVGTWLETRETVTGPTRRRARPAWESPNIRRITFGADNTFELIVCRPDGTPLDPARSLRGTWRLEGGEVKLAVSQNSLSGKYADWVPTDFTGPFEEQGQTRCLILHENGEEATYVRQQ